MDNVLNIFPIVRVVRDVIANVLPDLALKVLTGEQEPALIVYPPAPPPPPPPNKTAPVPIAGTPTEGHLATSPAVFLLPVLLVLLGLSCLPVYRARLAIRRAALVSVFVILLLPGILLETVLVNTYKGTLYVGRKVIGPVVSVIVSGICTAAAFVLVPTRKLGYAVGTAVVRTQRIARRLQLAICRPILKTIWASYVLSGMVVEQFMLYSWCGAVRAPRKIAGLANIVSTAVARGINSVLVAAFRHFLFVVDNVVVSVTNDLHMMRLVIDEVAPVLYDQSGLWLSKATDFVTHYTLSFAFKMVSLTFGTAYNIGVGITNWAFRWTVIPVLYIVGWGFKVYEATPPGSLIFVRVLDAIWSTVGGTFYLGTRLWLFTHWYFTTVARNISQHPSTCRFIRRVDRALDWLFVDMGPLVILGRVLKVFIISVLYPITWWVAYAGSAIVGGILYLIAGALIGPIWLAGHVYWAIAEACLILSFAFTAVSAYVARKVILGMVTIVGYCSASFHSLVAQARTGPSKHAARAIILAGIYALWVLWRVSWPVICDKLINHFGFCIVVVLLVSVLSAFADLFAVMSRAIDNIFRWATEESVEGAGDAPLAA